VTDPQDILAAGAGRSDRLRVLVNAGGAISGGAQTHLLAVAEEIGRGGDRGLSWEVIAPAALAAAARDAGGGALEVRAQRISSPIGRIAWEQAVLPAVWRRGGADVLLSVANFAPVARSARQVVVAGNALYFADVGLRGRRGARVRAEAVLGRASVRRAAVTVTPSEAMAALVRPVTTRPVVPVVFGPGRAERAVPSADGVFTFVHRTHWGPHKRLADVLEAVRLLAATGDGAFRVRSACDPRTDFARSWVESRPERALLEDPVIARHVSFETFPVEEQTEIAGDAVLLPSVTESFAFPLAEAVRVGLPVIAAEAPFARELCGDGAFFVPPHDPTAVAEAMRRLLRGERPPADPANVERLSWAAHVDGLAAVCRWAAGPMEAA
jgi:glycosyltransferase involved in cell wall biosynthesis